ncbi:MAG: MATE family efflux transporter [Candidatus Heritagella sp.]
MKIPNKWVGDRAFYFSMLHLAIPLIIQQAVSSFVSLLDNVMVGALGTESISGVAIVNQLVFVYYLTVFGTLSGASIFGSQFFGVGDHKGLRDTFRFRLIASLGLTVVAIVVFLTAGDSLTALFLTDDGTSDVGLTASLASQYMQITLWGLVPYAIAQVYSSVVRETGDAFQPMVASVLSILVNLLFNYLLIFGKLGFPAMGVAGAAWATVLSRYVECLYLLIATHRRPDKYLFIQGALRSLRIPLALCRRIVIMGLPLMLNECLWSLGSTMINQSYSTRGLTVVAATNIQSTVWNLFTIIMFAMGSVVSIMVGQRLGAGDIEGARETDTRLITFTVVLHVLIGTLLVLTAPYIPYIYNTTDEVRSLTTTLLYISGAVLPVNAFMHTCYFTVRSGGKTIITFLFDCGFTWCVVLPLVVCLCSFTDLPMAMIFLLAQLSEVIKAVIGFGMLKSGIWAKNLIHDLSGKTEESTP